MTLRDYLTQLLIGELASTPLAPVLLPYIATDRTDTTFTKEDKFIGQLIGFINTGLTNLHTRLDIRSEELFLLTNSMMDTYVLTQPHAVIGGEDYPDEKYILDTFEQPFLGNILKIQSVADEIGETLYLNDSNASYGVSVRNTNVIQVPYSEDYISMSVTYKANHPLLPFSVVLQHGEYYNLDYPMTLPGIYVQALNYFVVAKYFAAMGGADKLQESQLFTAMYEKEITDSRAAGILLGDYTERCSLIEGGFV